MGLVTLNGKAYEDGAGSVIPATTKRISGFLENGGGIQATGDYSVTPATFELGPAAGEVWQVTRFIAYIADGGSFSSTEYGDIPDGLANGYDVKVTDSGGDVLTLNGGLKIQTNGDFGALCYDVNNIGSGAGGNDAIAVRWTFAKAGSPLRLVGDNSEKISIEFSDNLSLLNKHTFFIDGYAE